MPSKKINLKGMRFGLYYVVSESSRIMEGGKPARMWNCVCDCGVERAVRQGALRSGSSSGCGCDFREKIAKKITKHGKYLSSIYATWSSMIQRCNSPKNPNYKYYGGRGISVCDKWLDFSGFYEDMGEKPSSELSIDRIDNNGNYEKVNCRWATSAQQAINTRIRYDNKSGIKGVRNRNGRWTAEIAINGKNKRIGTFGTIFDAAAARISKQNKLFKRYI